MCLVIKNMVKTPMMPRPKKPMVVEMPANPIQKVDEMLSKDGRFHKIPKARDPMAKDMDQPAVNKAKIIIPGINSTIKLKGAKMINRPMILIAKLHWNLFSVFLIS